jgi:ABC-type dipeptide/oligopeptide/nickel transport system permease subunit
LFTGIPPVLGALVLLRVVPNGAAALVLALVFFSWPRLFKALESRLLSDQGKGYRLAAAACGVPLHRFLVRYLGPSAFAVFLALAPLELAELVALEATLGFLGVGASDPEASLGRLVAEGRGLATVRPWAFAAPVAFLALLLAGFLWASAVRGRAAYG